MNFSAEGKENKKLVSMTSWDMRLPANIAST